MYFREPVELLTYSKAKSTGMEREGGIQVRDEGEMGRACGKDMDKAGCGIRGLGRSGQAYPIPRDSFLAFPV